MSSAHIPRVGLWNKAKDLAKPLFKALGLGSLWGTLGEKYHWGTVFLNYVAMRSPLMRWMRIGIWPQALYVEGTNICNARCVFCAYPQMERAKSTMPMGEFKRVIGEFAAAGGAEVDLSPIVGDPFVDKHIFERMDFLMTLPGVRRFHFFTNAILMKPEYAERLLGYGSRLTIYCSFGGFDQPTYHQVMGVDKFVEAVDGIRTLIEAKRASDSKLGIQVNLRIPPGNAKGEFWDFIVKARDEGLITIDGIDAYDSWAGMIKESDLAVAGLAARPMPVKRGPCHRLVTSPVLLVDGRVNACACRDVEANLIIGDTKTESLADILSSPALQDLLDKHEREDFPEVCKRCTYYDSLYPAVMRGKSFPFWRRLVAGF
ncbi:MAG: radical SAM protein [Elusimicrobia bacterium]|nr:radical SAM protein [Elusimicrobiota bacterium]